MTTTYRTAPQYDVPMTAGTKTTSSWYRWFQDTDMGTPPSSELPVNVGASPFIYSATMKGSVIVQGGAVSSIQISRSGTFHTTGVTQGLLNMAANDQLKIVFTSPPTLVFLPS
jgi:hypothetical protein